MSLRLSVLDQSVAISGAPQGEAIRRTIALAEATEVMGYHRFWVSEHHSHATIMGSAPEILVASIASRTSRIRVGTAGVMLPHYAPLKVAEQFRVLEAIAPGRIDLGLGRAPGSDGRTAYALNPFANDRPIQFPSDVRDVLAWLNGDELPEGHPFRTIKAYPAGDTSPEVWILGSSDYGAQVAAHFGLPYAFAWFFTDGRGGAEALRLYRDLYKPSARHPEPHAAICVWALAAETAEAARHQYWSRARARLLRDRGSFVPLEPPDVAAAYDYTDAERTRMASRGQGAILGTGAQVVAEFERMASELSLAEVAIVTWAWDAAVQRDSYRLIAEAAGLTPRS
jgi:luciferase family oxidoreductase group 1